MIVIPAIDALSEFRALSPMGRPGHHSAAAAARDFARYGFQRLHLSAVAQPSAWRAGESPLREILFEQSAEFQVQGGMTDADRVREVLALGARYAVVDGRSAEDPDALMELAESFPGEIMLGVDVRNRRVLTGPWPGARTLDLLDLTTELDTSILAGLVVSDSERRRRSLGPDLAFLEDLVESCDCPLYAAGGIDSITQLRALADRAVAGAVVGRAFAAGALDPFAVAEEFTA